MANSSYYYNQYKAYEKKAKDYGKNIEALNTIRNNISGTFSDEQSNVNQEIQDTIDNLKTGIKHNNTYNVNADKNLNYKEKTSTADGNLSSAIGSIDQEISSLYSLKSQAEGDANWNYNKYLEEKENERREREEWLKSLNPFKK